jgi:hypothetical protein
MTLKLTVLFLLPLSVALAAGPAAPSAPAPKKKNAAAEARNVEFNAGLEAHSQILEELKGKLAAESDPMKVAFLKVRVLREYGVVALDAGRKAEAKKMAEAALKTATGHERDKGLMGENLHYGNIVLGRLALLSGNLNGAKDYLAKSTRSSGSAVLSTFGPNFMLAYEILQKGEKKAVLDYLEACLSFWTQERDRNARRNVNAWEESIRAGKMPKFGQALFQ